MPATEAAVPEVCPKPTAGQRRILQAMAAGARIGLSASWSGLALIPAGHDRYSSLARTVQYPTVDVLSGRGWIARPTSGRTIYQITDAGRRAIGAEVSDARD